MTAAIDVQLPAGHPWAGEWLPGLVGRFFQIEITVDGTTQLRNATVIGAARLPPELGYAVILKVEIP